MKWEIHHSHKAAGAVMLVSEGYPGNYRKDGTISGFGKVKGSILFHAAP